MPHTPVEGRQWLTSPCHQVPVHFFHSLVWSLSRGSSGAFRQKPVTAPDLPVPVCEAQGKGVDLSEVPSALGDPSSGDATVTSLEWTVTTSETSFGQAWMCCIGR